MKHEHEWEKIEGTDYSRCKTCPTLRHNKDGHTFKTPKEALRPKGGERLDRFLFWIANPQSNRDIVLSVLIQIGLVLLLGAIATTLLSVMLG